MKVLAAMQERGMVLAFHGMANWEEPNLNAIPNWGAVQAIGVPQSNMVHMTNWLMSGMPERFPKLKVLWCESGVAWAHYLMQRLDTMYMTRVSEAPLLKEKPSHYMARMYLLLAAAGASGRPGSARSRVPRHQCRDAAGVGLQFPGAQLRRAGDDLGPAVPVRAMRRRRSSAATPCGCSDSSQESA